MKNLKAHPVYRSYLCLKTRMIATLPLTITRVTRWLMVKSNALYRYNDKKPYPRSSDSSKWNEILSGIWKRRKLYEGKGVVIPSDPNALLERQDLLLPSGEGKKQGSKV